jgi:hypothetical protein
MTSAGKSEGVWQGMSVGGKTVAERKGKVSGERLNYAFGRMRTALLEVPRRGLGGNRRIAFGLHAFRG